MLLSSMFLTCLHNVLCWLMYACRNVVLRRLPAYKRLCLLLHSSVCAIRLWHAQHMPQ